MVYVGLSLAMNCSSRIDISPNVLVSFMLSAFVTVAAVTYAYLSDSMPEDELRETDKAFITNYQTGIKRVTSYGPFLAIGLCWLTIQALLVRQDVTRERQKSADGSAKQRLLV
jgi:hypothetical protein